MRWAEIWAESSPGLATSQLAREDTDLRNERRHKWRAWPSGPGHTTGHISCRVCCARAVALQPWPLDHAMNFYSSVLKGVSVTNVGNSVQVDTNTWKV